MFPQSMSSPAAALGRSCVYCELPTSGIFISLLFFSEAFFSTPWAWSTHLYGKLWVSRIQQLWGKSQQKEAGSWWINTPASLSVDVSSLACSLILFSFSLSLPDSLPCVSCGHLPWWLILYVSLTGHVVPRLNITSGWSVRVVPERISIWTDRLSRLPFLEWVGIIQSREAPERTKCRINVPPLFFFLPHCWAWTLSHPLLPMSPESHHWPSWSPGRRQDHGNSQTPQWWEPVPHYT